MSENNALKCPSCGSPVAGSPGACAVCRPSQAPASHASTLLSSNSLNLAEISRQAQARLLSDPSDTLAHLQLGVCCLKLGDKTNALAELAKAQDLAPLDSDIIYAHAFVWALARGWTNPRVSGLAEHALSVAPGMNEARALLCLYAGQRRVENLSSDLAEAKRQYAGAVEEYRKALEFHVPEISSYAYFFSGEAFDAFADYEEAVRMYQEARRKGCGEPRLPLLLGVALARLGRRDEARAQLEAALEADPDNRALRMMLADLA